MSIHRLPELESDPIFDHVSIFALASVATILATAYSCSFAMLHKSCNTKVRVLFVWHLFDALIHLTLETSYLYNIFFTSMPKLSVTYTRGMYSTPMTPVNVSFLGDSSHLHGSFYGVSMTAKLWQEYAKADKRWGGSDLSIASLELITVFVMAPLALYVCHLLLRGQYTKASFWMVIVAVGELYGGSITLLPEWLSGSPHLDISNFLTLWVYLVFFKMLWVLFPLWVLSYAYQGLTSVVGPMTPGLSNGTGKRPLKPTVYES